jgi:hypothetical protein
MRVSTSTIEQVREIEWLVGRVDGQRCDVGR